MNDDHLLTAIRVGMVLALAAAVAGLFHPASVWEAFWLGALAVSIVCGLWAMREF